MKHALQLIRPKVIFVTKSSVETILNVIKEYSFTKKVIQYGGEYGIKGTMLFNSIMQDHRYSKVNGEYISPPEDLDRVAIIAMSSGTTGMPKGVQLTERNILASSGQLW